MDRSPLSDDQDDPRRSDSLNDSAAEHSESSSRSQRTAEFERIYRGEFATVASYFARRTHDPQLVAQLIADTFVAAIHAFSAYDPSDASARAWMVGIARRIDRRRRESDPRDDQRSVSDSISGLLDRSERKEMLYWIDVESSSRDLMVRLARMSEMDREALELVDLCGLDNAEAARELGISNGQLRVRLVRTRARLRREAGSGV